jgi:hypothetical protein
MYIAYPLIIIGIPLVYFWYTFYGRSKVHVLGVVGATTSTTADPIRIPHGDGGTGTDGRRTRILP